MSTPDPLPPVDPDLEVLISSVTLTGAGDNAPSSVFTRSQPDVSARVSWQTKPGMLSMMGGTWHLKFHLQSLTSDEDRDLGDFSVPAVPGSVSYTEEAKINVGTATEGEHRLVTSVSFLNPNGSPLFVGFHEQVIKIVSD
jgi:hypothetical protein